MAIASDEDRIPEAFRLSAYDYQLPPELIAQTPVEPRDASRLLVVRRDRDEIEHGVFRDLPQRLNPGDVVVLNETRVIPARLHGTRRGSGGKVELLLLQPVEGAAENVWRAMARPARRLRPGTLIDIGSTLRAEVVAEEPAGVRHVRLIAEEEGRGALERALAEAGQVPLPPYIRTPLDDPERYQTVFARERGSVAAPTAGLHFTAALLAELHRRGVTVVPLILHVGRGTFQPVETEDVRQHRLEPERYRIPAETAAAVIDARSRGNRVIAVGTTVTRALESAVDDGGGVRSGEGQTDLFITPGFTFRAVDGLVTNFHLPRTTLLMLVSAFLGRERTLAVYREAVARKYRFYSFGDAMLIL